MLSVKDMPTGDKLQGDNYIGENIPLQPLKKGG